MRTQQQLLRNREAKNLAAFRVLPVQPASVQVIDSGRGASPRTCLARADRQRPNHPSTVATLVKPLRIAVSLRLVAKHKPMPRVLIETSRDVIHRAEADKTRTHGDQLMVADLERVTAIPVAELARLTEKWPAS